MGHTQPKTVLQNKYVNLTSFVSLFEKKQLFSIIFVYISDGDGNKR